MAWAKDVPTLILDDSDFTTAKRAGSWLFSDVEQSGKDLGSSFVLSGRMLKRYLSGVSEDFRFR